METSQHLRDKIIGKVLDHLREHGKMPPTVYAVCRDLQISEKEFYQEFPSLDAVESAHWRNVMDHNIRKVENSSEWQGFNSQQRLLAFLYAYFEDSLCHRSLLLLRFGGLNVLQEPVSFREASQRFLEFARDIVKKAIQEREIADRGRLNDIYPRGLLLQFRTVLDFHLRDTSPGFERTDVLIEKTTRLAFDLMKTSALDSAIDLARWVMAFRNQGAVAKAPCGAM